LGGAKENIDLSVDDRRIASEDVALELITLYRTFSVSYIRTTYSSLNGVYVCLQQLSIISSRSTRISQLDVDVLTLAGLHSSADLGQEYF